MIIQTSTLKNISKRKIKVVSVHNMKVDGGRRYVAPLVFNPGTSWTEMAKFTLRPLYLRKEPPYY
jgi:hypothetical protein